MTHLVILAAMLLCACAAVQSQNYRTTPVPILKQINRHNDDGSYSYGYEGADGSFKIETKYPTGEVYGKYGYVGDDGKVREIEYGASRRGFEPVGTDINVPPPTLSNSVKDNSLDYDDGQYHENPATYYKKSGSSRASFGNDFQHYQFSSPSSTPAPQYYNPPPPPKQYYNPPAPQHYNPPTQYPRQWNGHPATNVNLQTGSYSLSYSG